MKTPLIPVTVQTNEDNSLNFRDGKARTLGILIVSPMSWRRICKTQEVSCWSCVLTYTLLSFNISRLWQRNIFMFTSGTYLMTSHQKMKLLWLSWHLTRFFPIATLPQHVCIHRKFSNIFFFSLFMAHIKDNSWNILTQ